MSDYTPTTDEVRLNTVMRDGKSYEVSFAEFDRWLAAHDAEVERAAGVKALVNLRDLFSEARAEELEDAADQIFVQHSEPNAEQREAFNRGADAVYDAMRKRAKNYRR